MHRGKAFLANAGFRFFIFLLLVSVLPASAQTPRYKNYLASFPLLGGDGAEPSLGVNWNSGNVMYQGGLETIRIQFDDSTSPATTNWEIIPTLITSLFSLDPILFTDRQTNRTLVSQLDGGCSLTEFTDDDGTKWNFSAGCGIPAGFDHQSVGGGPYAASPVIDHPSYPNTVYYCSQNLVSAICSRSDNGGVSFGPGVPIYLLTECGGRHGRVKVAPDGTVYVPNSACGAEQGVAVSEDNGLTWAVRKIPGSMAGASDPSIGIGANGKVYFGHQNGDGHPRIAVSTDRGQTWTNDQDVGASFGIQNVVFPAVVAGDDNRAAFAFLGTPTGGNYQDTNNFAGVWHLYIASTFDGGLTWVTVDVTPNDPVQIGSINLQHGVQPSGRRITSNMSSPLLPRGDRNLLDFIDASVDNVGRVLVAYADGCVTDCVTSPSTSLSRSALAAVARQSGGKRLFAIYDPTEPAAPQAPLLTGSRSSTGVTLSWSEPDHGGAPLKKFRIYRRTANKPFELRKKVKDLKTFQDTRVIEGVTYFYRVSARNRKGEGMLSNEVGL